MALYEHGIIRGFSPRGDYGLSEMTELLIFKSGKSKDSYAFLWDR